MPLKRSSAVRTQAEPGEQGTARLVVDIPAELHRAMKIRAATEGRTLRDYLIEVLGADMAAWNAKPK